MILLESILSPVSIVFWILILGYFVGKIKICGISLDLAAVLIVAVVTGYILTGSENVRNTINIPEMQENMQLLSSLGTALFVPSVGLSTGGILDFRNSKDLKALVIGSAMAVSSFVVMRTIALTDCNITTSKLLGVLCGALTSTPGLSAACELKNVVPNDIILGYGCAYLFGVIATVLFVQVISNKSMDTSNVENNVKKPYESKAALYGLLQIGCVIVLGRIIGNIEIVNFSLGSSGGMLCTGIIVGIIVKKVNFLKSLTTKMLAPFRNMGLVLFFVGNGIPAGMQLTSGVEIKMIFYGALMTVAPIVSGVFLYKIFYKDGLSVTIIAGGMTSTPAIGVLAEKDKKISLSKYALAYFGALITIVILIRVVVIL